MGRGKTEQNIGSYEWSILIWVKCEWDVSKEKGVLRMSLYSEDDKSNSHLVGKGDSKHRIDSSRFQAEIKSCWDSVM